MKRNVIQTALERHEGRGQRQGRLGGSGDRGRFLRAQHVILDRVCEDMSVRAIPKSGLGDMDGIDTGGSESLGQLGLDSWATENGLAEHQTRLADKATSGKI